MKSNVLIALLLLATLMPYENGALAAEGAPRGLETLNPGLTAPEGLELEVRNLAEDIDVAYLECEGIDDVEPAYGRLFNAAARQGLLRLDMNVYLVSHNDPLHTPDNETRLEAAISVPASRRVNSPIQVQTLPAGDYIVLSHRGDYEKLAGTFQAFKDWATAVELAFDEGPVFEHFLTNPDITPVKDWLTEIYFPVCPSG